MDLSIIIVNFNTWEYCLNCIRSVIYYTRELNYEIILVDNASAYWDEDILKKEFPAVIVVRNEANLGFAAANNIGIQKSTGKYVLLLNSDTYLERNAFLSLYDFLEKRNDIGIVSPRLIYPNKNIQGVAQRFPSVKYKLIEIARLQKLIPRSARGKLLLGAFFDHSENVEVDWVWGACMMIRKEAILKLPLQKLNESYFMYWEDVQWCWDMKKAGYKVFFFSETEVVHIHKGGEVNKNIWMKKNKEKFLKKNYNLMHRNLIYLLDKWI